MEKSLEAEHVENLNSMEKQIRTSWKVALELTSDRKTAAGSELLLAAAVRRGADLRIYTEFIHNQHIDVTSDCDDRVQEVAEFGITYLLRDQWVAGIMSLRQPIELPSGFGPRPSMSFFLYNQDGQQAIARPFLDGVCFGGKLGSSRPRDSLNGPAADESRFHMQDAWDADTNAPSLNFVYDFDVYRFCVSDSWREVLCHDARGVVLGGSLAELVEAFRAGCELKVGVRGLCTELANNQRDCPDHEVFVQAGPGYYYTERQLFMAGSHPVVRACPGIPMVYHSNGWDFGWLLLRTDGHIVYRRCDPYTLQFQDTTTNLAVRWFVR